MKTFNCPMCGVPLTEQEGEQIHPGNPAFGITLFCANRSCPCQEVMGHGRNVKEAMEVITHKFSKKKD